MGETGRNTREDVQRVAGACEGCVLPSDIPEVEIDQTLLEAF